MPINVVTRSNRLIVQICVFWVRLFIINFDNWLFCQDSIKFSGARNKSLIINGNLML